MDNRNIGVDAPRVADEQEAVSLMLHHLKLAAMYFEATPLVIPAEAYVDDHSATAISAWLNAIEALYPEETVA